MDIGIRRKKNKVINIRENEKNEKSAKRFRKYDLFFASGNLCNFVGIIMEGWIRLLIYLSEVV